MVEVPKGFNLCVSESQYHREAPLNGYVSSGAINRAYWDIADAHDYLTLRTHKPPSPAMEKGTMVHKLALEGEEAFYAQYAIMPSEIKDLRRKADKELLKEWSELNSGKEHIKRALFDEVAQVANSAVRQPIGGDLTLGDLVESKQGVPEATLVWDENGIPCKARPDFWSPGLVIDLKTSRDPWDFEHDLFKRGYHRQAAHYLHGLSTFTEEKHRWVWIVVGTEAPYTARAVEAGEDLLMNAEVERMWCMEKIHNAIASGTWRETWADRLTTANLPSWYRTRVTA